MVRNRSDRDMSRVAKYCWDGRGHSRRGLIAMQYVEASIVVAIQEVKGVSCRRATKLRKGFHNTREQIEEGLLERDISKTRRRAAQAICLPKRGPSPVKFDSCWKSGGLIGHFISSVHALPLELTNQPTRTIKVRGYANVNLNSHNSIGYT